MALPVSTIVNSVRFTMLDASKTTFSDAELIGYANEGMWQSCSVKPDLYTDTSGFTLAAGVVQDLGEDTNVLLDVLYNQADSSPVTQVDRALMEVADPNWTKATAGPTVHYMYDVRRPRQFMVYPPAVDSAVLVIVTGKRPAGMAALSDPIPITETYQPALIDYVLSRTYAKNTKKQDITKSDLHYKRWAAAVGLRVQAERTTAATTIADGNQT